MSGDNFFKDLGQQWKQEQAVHAFSVEEALRVQGKQRRKHYLHLALGAFTLLVEFYFLTLPLAPATLGGAFVLIASVVFDLWYSRRYRRPIVQWDDWSPEGLLTYRQRLLRAELRNALYYILSSVVILMFTALLWIYAWLAPTFASTGFHKLFGICALPIAGFCIVFFGTTLRRKRQHFRRLSDLLSDYSSAD